MYFLSLGVKGLITSNIFQELQEMRYAYNRARKQLHEKVRGAWGILYRAGGGGGGGGTHNIFRWECATQSWKPLYPISDQNLRLSIPYFRRDSQCIPYFSHCEVW